MSRVFVCEASPSLALLKYWGKLDPHKNTPATPSLGVSLGALTTRTAVSASEKESRDRVLLAGREQPLDRYLPFLEALREKLRTRMHFLAESKNNFPTSAGLASSSSAFAALAYACTAAVGATLERAELSALARVGSASAARAVFGGFTLLPAGESSARQLFDEHYWPELRILVSLVTRESKDTSSRDAMEASRRTSPFYPAWVKDAASLLPDALDALEKRDIERLGEAARRSYLRMFATMLSADPPILYWLPESLSIIHECERMRKAGIGVWETMDAGPQVKLICLAGEVADVRKGLLQALPGLAIIESWAGPAPVCAEAEETPWHA